MLKFSEKVVISGVVTTFYFFLNYNADLTFSQIYFYCCHYYNFCRFDILIKMCYNHTEDIKEKGEMKKWEEVVQYG